MPRSWSRRQGLVVACLVGLGTSVLAQDRPVVLVHGVGSSPETWAEAAGRLQLGLQVAPERPAVSWRSSLETQANELQSALGRLPDSTVTVGHSLGGLAGRQWSRIHPMDGLVTVGSPNRGAPMANHLNEWVGFNTSLFGAVGNAFYWLGNVSYDQWWWVFSAVEGALNWGGYVADFSIRHLLVELGMQYGYPFVQEIAVGSPYLEDLNGANLGREAAQIPNRIAIVNTASRYWSGGPFRLKDPDYGGELSLVTSAAAAALDYWGFHVFSEADPLDWQAQSLAYGLWDTAFWLWNFDEFWCRSVSDDRPLWAAHCLPNDGFIPTWSQFYPGGTLNVEINGGPVHTGETRQFADVLYAVLTQVMHVPPRDGAPGGPAPAPSPGPGPGPAPGGGPDTLPPDQSLYPDQVITSSNGQFYLTYQWDGNLVMFRSDGVPLWQSHTDGTSAGRVIMQLDGNLVVYDAADTPLWESGTAGHEGAQMVMQSDGNLVIYAADGVPLWASGTGGL